MIVSMRQREMEQQETRILIYLQVFKICVFLAAGSYALVLMLVAEQASCDGLHKCKFADSDYDVLWMFSFAFKTASALYYCDVVWQSITLAGLRFKQFYV